MTVGATLTLVVPLVGAIAQSLPPGIEESVGQVLGFLSLERALLLGGSGLASLAGVRWLVKRKAGTEGPSGTHVRTTGDPTVASSRSTAGKGDVAIMLPGLLPVSEGIREVTHDEVHALELGFLVGIVAAWLYAIGRTEVVATIVVAFVVGSLGYKRYSSKAFKTVRKEPWYALLALAVGGGLGYWIFLAEPEVITSALEWVEQLL